MIRVLLDTHIFLWYITADSQLEERYQQIITDPDNEVWLSVASIWEVVIKNQIGKLPSPQPPATYLPTQCVLHGISLMSIDEGCMPFLEGLPLLHRDPFDRIIIAQALQHNLQLATVDSAVKAYSVPLL